MLAKRERQMKLYHAMLGRENGGEGQVTCRGTEREGDADGGDEGGGIGMNKSQNRSVKKCTTEFEGQLTKRSERPGAAT